MRVVIAADFWFWALCGFGVLYWFERWAKRELLRLREARLKQLEESLAKLDKELSLRIESWKILEDMEPEMCERVWKVIKDRTLQHWLDSPKAKQAEGGN